MGDELKTVRLQVLISPSELEAIDDWSWGHRVRSRGEAVRRLIQLGLEASQAREPSDLDDAADRK
jgi:hypothetical protein